MINIMMYILAPMSMDTSFMTACIVVALLTIFAFIKKCDSDFLKLNKIHFRHSIYFVLCYLIVFYQCDIDYLLGYADLSINYLWYDEKVVAKALALSNIGLTCIFIGYLFKLNANKNVFKNTNSLTYLYPYKSILILISIVLLLVYIVFVPKEFLNKGYARGLSSEVGQISIIMGYIVSVFVAMLTLYSIEYKRDITQSWIKFMKWPLIIISIYILLVVVTGRRTEAIRMSVMVLISYLYCKNGLVNYYKLGVIGLSFVLAFALIGILREMQTISIESGFATLNENSSIMPFTKEIAGSVNTLHIAMSHFPEQYEYTHGLTFFPGFLKLIPGLSSLYINYLLPQGHHYSSDTMITNIYFGGDAIWGLGSSINADIYISFGIVGIVFIMFWLGYFLRYLEVETFVKSSSIYFIALSFGCYSQFIYACRQSIPIMFLSWTYACILIFIITRKKIRVK